MKGICFAGACLLACCQPAWGIYGPSLARADAPIALQACQEAKFAKTYDLMKAMTSGNSEGLLLVLDGALQELRVTPAASELYAAREFCIHEVVPNHLPREGEVSSPLARKPTAIVVRFENLGIRYFYYDPDAEWILDKDPVDLNELATKHLDSHWGREAFLMMTRIGWSQGACKEGPDQFREVIRHAETFLERYPRSEVSDSVRLELAHAYATWWNLSRTEPSASFSPEPYIAGADTAKQKAIELYRLYLNRQEVPRPEIQNRLKALLRNPKGSNRFDYFCPDYED